MAQTRPSAIVRRPDPETPVSELTTAELLYEALGRTEARRLAAALVPTADLVARDEQGGDRQLMLGYERDLERATDAIQDAISLHNRAVYRERGVFAITDAERITDESATLLVVQDSPVEAPSRVAVVAKSSADAKGAARDCGLEDGWVAVLEPAHAIGHHFDKVVYAAGYDRARTKEETLRLRSAVEAAMRS